MNRAALVLVVSLVAISCLGPAEGSGRGLLWHVVQACVANHALTGAAFPCLSVDTSDGAADGYAVLRAPLEETHIVVLPTVRTVGIEAKRLRGAGAPNYFYDAWLARHFVTDTLPRKPDRDDLGLAVNSRAGRSQDQLHIHVDCLRPDVVQSLVRQASMIHPHAWTRVSVLPEAPRYWATAVASADLSRPNLFDLAAEGLKIEDPDEMGEATMVVAGADSVNGAPGFILLARKRRPNSGDIAHGEALLDHSCAAFH